MSYGFVYLMSNPAMPCLYKVGFTERSPHQRCNELSASTSVPSEFVVVCYMEADDCQWLERQMHEWMADFRVNRSREFFSVRPGGLPWLLGLFKFNPWALAYTECDLSDIAMPGFEDLNPWRYGGDEPHGCPVPPLSRGELRLVA